MAAQTLQELVSTAASLHPDRAAVTYDSGSSSGSPLTLKYRDLIELAGELSRVLQDHCRPNKGVIGLYCGDDLLIPVWILGILQSAAAYVPLDPEAPGLLSARVMNHCGLRYCAVKTDLLQQFQAALVKHITVEVCVELPKFKLTLLQVEPPPPPAADNEQGAEQVRARTGEDADLCDGAVFAKGAGHRDLAYVLHTSGTTGLPKTVRVPHKCILPNILHLRSLFQIRAADVVFLSSPLTFDPSVVDIFLALSSGAQLLIAPAVIKKMPNRLAQLLFKDHRTTVLQVTPTLLLRFGHRILKRDVLSSSSSLRLLALGGEACPSPALLRSWKHEDNKTHIYNIYGITEVSCWACCYKIPESLLQSTNLSVSSVPLGTPLMDTAVEVRDEHGCVITEGEGQVFIGGEDRVCLLDDEDAVVPGTMRATGDWVNVKDEQLYYLGRRDRMIKRHGKQVNLDSLQQLVLSLPQVEACAVGLHEGLRLLAFVVASTPGDHTADSTSSSVQAQEPSAPAERQETLPSSVKPHPEEAAGADGDLKRLILRRLSLLLPSHSVPDTLVLVPALCLTPHGKVDMEALMRIYERLRRCLKSSQADDKKLEQTLKALWQEALGVAGDATIDEESNFLFSGGDSLKALTLTEDILNAVGGSSPELLEVILDGTFCDVLRHIARVTSMPPLENRPSSPSVAKKRHAESPSEVLMKRERKLSTSAEGLLQVERRAVKVVRRAGEVLEMNIRDTENSKNLEVDKQSGRGRDVGVGLSLSWSSDTGRCVDASPVLLVQDKTDQRSDVSKATVFIGSHSHRIQALDLLTGSLLWERVLGDRIEASAAVSHCGALVVVGCYDGRVYFLCAESGETRWTFETGDAVKSCPAVDPLSGLMTVGSHDGHVYALNPQIRQCVWKRHCGGGAVFSSPHLDPSLRQLYVATLGGRLLCLNLDSGDVLWSYCRDVPFFSSPNCFSDRVVIGSVDGNICCLSNTGKLLWEFLTKGPVFSSPCVTADQRRLLCGSHDGRLYCLNCADGSLVWAFETTGKVYSAPCVFDGSAAGRRGTLVALASTDGAVWILDGQDGQMLASHPLPGELFSSPVVWERSLVVGCRNDYVYCLQMTVQET